MIAILAIRATTFDIDLIVLYHINKKMKEKIVKIYCDFIITEDVVF